MPRISVQTDTHAPRAPSTRRRRGCSPCSGAKLQRTPPLARLPGRRDHPALRSLAKRAPRPGRGHIDESVASVPMRPAHPITRVRSSRPADAPGRYSYVRTSCAPRPPCCLRAFRRRASRLLSPTQSRRRRRSHGASFATIAIARPPSMPPPLDERSSQHARPETAHARGSYRTTPATILQAGCLAPLVQSGHAAGAPHLVAVSVGAMRRPGAGPERPATAATGRPLTDSD
jgi:hypothetical protein